MVIVVRCWISCVGVGDCWELLVIVNCCWLQSVAACSCLILLFIIGMCLQLSIGCWCLLVVWRLSLTLYCSYLSLMVAGFVVVAVVLLDMVGYCWLWLVVSRSGTGGIVVIVVVVDVVCC